MKSEFLIKMGKRISSRRKELGMTQEKLSEEMDVTVQMISNMELGKKAVRPENLAAAAKALDVSTDYLLTGSAGESDSKRLYEEIEKLSPEGIILARKIITLLAESENGGGNTK